MSRKSHSGKLPSKTSKRAASALSLPRQFKPSFHHALVSTARPRTRVRGSLAATVAQRSLPRQSRRLAPLSSLQFTQLAERVRLAEGLICRCVQAVKMIMLARRQIDREEPAPARNKDATIIRHWRAAEGPPHGVDLERARNYRQTVRAGFARRRRSHHGGSAGGHRGAVARRPNRNAGVDGVGTLKVTIGKGE